MPLHLLPLDGDLADEAEAEGVAVYMYRLLGRRCGASGYGDDFSLFLSPSPPIVSNDPTAPPRSSQNTHVRTHARTHAPALLPQAPAVGEDLVPVGQAQAAAVLAGQLHPVGAAGQAVLRRPPVCIGAGVGQGKEALAPHDLAAAEVDDPVCLV
jgi:hypothetical protein